LCPCVGVINCTPSAAWWSTISISQWLQNASAFLDLTTRKLQLAYSRFPLQQASYGMASAACVLTLIAVSASVTVTQKTAPTVTSLKPVQTLDFRPSDPTISPLVPPAPIHSIVALVPKVRKVARSKMHRTTPPHRNLLARRFSGPVKLHVQPDVDRMFASQMVIESTVALVPPPFSDVKSTLDMTAPERPKGMRRVLLAALAYPFKRLGQGLSN
jgi:hypothetical protein